jgi:hypothetical protein
MNFNTKVWLSLAALGVIMGAFLFVPAGTVYYWQAWVFLTIYIGASIPPTLYLMRHDPAGGAGAGFPLWVVSRVAW